MKESEREGKQYVTFLSVVLLVLSVLFLLMGYAYFNNKAENLLMWSLDGNLEEQIKDQATYKKQSGLFFSILGVIFFLIPISIYYVDRFELNTSFLYLWIVILGVVVIVYSLRVNKNKK